MVRSVAAAASSRRPPPIPPEALRARRAPAPPPVPELHPHDAPEVVVETAAAQRGREASELVAAAKAGDARAFTALVRLYRPRILALALHMTGNLSDAEDVAQESFLRAFQHLPEFEGRSAFFTWLYRITLNKSLQTRQRCRAHWTAGLDDPRVALAVAVDAGGAPGRALELRETYAQLLFAFDRLSPLLRTTVALTTLQGLSYPEAAVVLETTEGTIAWRMHEARRQLRASLDAAAAEPAHAAVRAPARPARPPRPTAPERAPDTLSYSLAFALASVLYA